MPPAAIYMLNNYLTFVNLTIFDPATCEPSSACLVGVVGFVFFAFPGMTSSPVYAVCARVANFAGGGEVHAVPHRLDLCTSVATVFLLACES